VTETEALCSYAGGKERKKTFRAGRGGEKGKRRVMKCMEKGESAGKKGRVEAEGKHGSRRGQKGRGITKKNEDARCPGATENRKVWHREA